MKKIIPVLLVALLLSACTTNATENKEESVYPVTASMSYTIDLSNPSDVAEQADYVALSISTKSKELITIVRYMKNIPFLIHMAK